MPAILRDVEAFGGCSLVVKLQPSKLVMWVRFPSPAFFGGLKTDISSLSSGEGDKSNRGYGDNLRKSEIRKKISSS